MSDYVDISSKTLGEVNMTDESTRQREKEGKDRANNTPKPAQSTYSYDYESSVIKRADAVYTAFKVAKEAQSEGN